jgi:hypothetical protein
MIESVVACNMARKARNRISRVKNLALAKYSIVATSHEVATRHCRLCQIHFIDL